MKNKKCLIDNLWICYHRTAGHKEPDKKYFVACINSLIEYFQTARTSNFKFCVVIHGRKTGVFHTWLELVDSIQGIIGPQFKGFNDHSEALDTARDFLALISLFLFPSELLENLLLIIP